MGGGDVCSGGVCGGEAVETNCWIQLQVQTELNNLCSVCVMIRINCKYL